MMRQVPQVLKLTIHFMGVNPRILSSVNNSNMVYRDIKSLTNTQQVNTFR